MIELVIHSGVYAFDLCRKLFALVLLLIDVPAMSPVSLNSKGDVRTAIFAGRERNDVGYL